MVLMFSLEVGTDIKVALHFPQVCLRLYHSNKRVGDPEIDNLKNPHEVQTRYVSRFEPALHLKEF